MMGVVSRVCTHHPRQRHHQEHGAIYNPNHLTFGLLQNEGVLSPCRHSTWWPRACAISRVIITRSTFGSLSTRQSRQASTVGRKRVAGVWGWVPEQNPTRSRRRRRDVHVYRCRGYVLRTIALCTLTFGFLVGKPFITGRKVR